jgi:hypothetical protein
MVSKHCFNEAAAKMLGVPQVSDVSPRRIQQSERKASPILTEGYMEVNIMVFLKLQIPLE